MRTLSLSLLLPLAFSACKKEAVYEPVCTEPTAVSCFDDLLIDLSLQDAVSNGRVTNTPDGEGWVSTVDATAGGFGNSANNPWVYVKFTDEGLARVDITDEDALDSMEWHLAARRFILRLNSGASGPSCVQAAAIANGDYTALSAADAEGATFFADDYYTESCDMINDSSGLPGSPQVALAPWWSYPGCVATTDVPFIVRLDSGRQLKLIVDQYYGSGQEQCNSQGAPGNDGGEYTLRWSFVD
ncbi:MAG: HmuY family protein [Alphaproteobacteria bacterium]|nr:HmuY family protein [Alphaproteobacteria bacterium]